MRTHCIAQRALLKAQWWPSEKEVQKGGDILICKADTAYLTYMQSTS